MGKELLRLVDAVVDNNDGIPFTNELFAHSTEISDFEETYDEQLKLFTEESESKLRGGTLGLEKQLADEQVARTHVEAKVQEVQIKTSFEINMLKKNLDEARREAEELRESRRETEVMLEETKKKFKEIEEIFKEIEQKFAIKFKETEKNVKVNEKEDENYEGNVIMCNIL